MPLNAHTHTISHVHYHTLLPMCKQPTCTRIHMVRSLKARFKNAGKERAPLISSVPHSHGSGMTYASVRHYACKSVCVFVRLCGCVYVCVIDRISSAMYQRELFVWNIRDRVPGASLLKHWMMSKF